MTQATQRMFANSLDRSLSACTDHSACKYLHGSSSERIVEKVRLYESVCLQKKITAAGYVFAQNRPFCTRGSFFVEIGLFLHTSSIVKICSWLLRQKWAFLSKSEKMSEKSSQRMAQSKVRRVGCKSMLSAKSSLRRLVRLCWIHVVT